MSDFYQRVRSRLIVEDSYGVMFALYCLRYKGIEEELREASLDEETEKWRMISCGCRRFSYQTGVPMDLLKSLNRLRQGYEDSGRKKKW
ncbi:hypothetical protein DVH24_039281 [Malus domestica]|uniref:Tubulin binding cofactor C-like domain-containing protein n=1 Tax=Malus domestica TaxID=3750 RepID=A0A498I031_MALDO|nr:hypothetical protein DVH24_039281 [Malus domestica]